MGSSAATNLTDLREQVCTASRRGASPEDEESEHQEAVAWAEGLIARLEAGEYEMADDPR
ncbi:hypothetical protein BH708_15045 [Brachybacterium sp. P6-10-X1]|nr:hypothetical protein BH708_15045 [Brachybacterium sp. P6-10-X1]